MSEKSKEGEHSQTQSEHSEKTKEVNVNELVERLKQLEATNARILEESKKTKANFQERLSQYENIDKERLEKEGDFKTLLEKEKERGDNLSSSMTEMKKKVLSSNIRSAVAKYSSDVHDIDDLLNQPNFSHILKDGINDIDLTIGEEKVKEYITEVLKAKPYMKKASTNIPIIDSKPQFQTGDGVTKGIDELSSIELEKLIASRFK